MIRVGEAIAKQNKAIALVSGESIGQVASQTVENIATIDSVATIPILRPLIGMDKIEIINEAIILDTFNISIEPDMDCCSLMIPKKPVIKSTATRAAFLEKDLDIEYLVANTVRNTEIIDV
jgi:thiamine biosynthesis protein ThiI